LEPKTRVLVVDDEEHIRLLYSEELKDEGYEVATAESARDAAKKIEEFKPHVITLDIRMPGQDGIEFLRKFRERDKVTPVILCTAYSDYKQDFRVWASEGYVVKSADMAPLKKTIKEVLEKAGVKS
jgi:DNA-binding NtrC family response regulator